MIRKKYGCVMQAAFTVISIALGVSAEIPTGNIGPCFYRGWRAVARWPGKNAAQEAWGFQLI